MDIYRFARLSGKEKQELLKQAGEVLEVNLENDQVTKVYYLMGFFVEVTIENGEEIDPIPYARGFKLAKEKEVYECAA